MQENMMMKENTLMKGNTLIKPNKFFLLILIVTHRTILHQFIHLKWKQSKEEEILQVVVNFNCNTKMTLINLNILPKKEKVDSQLN